MFRLEFTCINGKPHGSGAHLQEGRGFRQIHPPLRLFILRTVTRNAVVTSQRRYTFFRPTIASACPVSVAIENPCDQVIVTDVGEQGNGFDERFVGMAVVVSAPTPGNTYFRVQTTFPMD